ncbi:MAG: DUF1080 domain-containing protein [Phycisphaerae bacterium]|jgi:hypothetical protein|nr:DUF1080 domain-containing protein [Phycisphaerae bacterium]
MFTAAIAVALLALDPQAKPERPTGSPPATEAAPGDKPAPANEPAKAKPTGDETAIRLFNGVSLEGWKVFVPEGSADGLWSVEDGNLVCAGNPIGYLVTDREFESFELTLEWRFDPKKGAGNSGVLLRVQRPDKVWPTSIEAQLHSLNAGDIWNIGEVPMKPDASRTEGRRTRKLQETNEKPLGEWNRYRIVVDGGKLELYVNDLLQNSATDVQVRPGRIALQSEGSHIEFRKIELRELGGRAPASAPARAPAKPEKR